MAGPIRISILANGKQARREFDLTGSSANQMGRLVGRAGKVFAAGFAIDRLARAGVAVGKVGASYVDSLNKIQALTGSTNRQIDQAASRLEKNSAVYAKYGQTAGDAASGVVELAKSGLSLKKSLSAVRGTMLLAKAGELSVADASSFVSNTLNTFSLKASQAATIANSLANAANISSADVTDLAESFKYAAPLAARAGLSVDQTSAILAELANQGVKASQAGTSLRQMLIRLQAPTTAANISLDEMGVKIFQANGKVKPFRDILGQLATGIDKLKGSDRAYALKNIFGVNAMTAASILLKGNVKQLDAYTAGTKRAGAANKLAASASKGLAGTLAQIKAEATSGAQAFYREYSPKLNTAIQHATQFISDNKDEVLNTAKAAEGKLAPALKALSRLAADTADAFSTKNGGLAKSIGGDALDAIGKLLELTTKVADGLDKIPGPLKAIGVEAGIAALVVSKFNTSLNTKGTFLFNTQANIAAMKQFSAEMTYSVTRTQRLEAGMARLASAARAAAGIGGMVLLAQSASTTNDSLKGLEQVGGGALLGFSAAGPIGGAIGASVAALAQLRSGTATAASTAHRSIRTWQDYADTLNDATGAMTEQTRSDVIDSLYKAKVTQNVATLGLRQQQVISAVLGEGRARKQVSAALDAQTARIAQLRREAELAASGDDANGNRVRERNLALADQLTVEANKRESLVNSIRDETGQLAKSLKIKRDQIALDKKIPTRIVQSFQTEGLPKTKEALAQLIKQQGVARRKVQAVITASGVKTTVKQVEGIVSALKAVDKTHPNLTRTYGRGLQDDIGTLQRQARHGTDEIAKLFSQGTRNAKPDLDPFLRGLVTATTHAKAQAHGGGAAVGEQLDTGAAAGIRAHTGVLSAAAREVIASAIASMRAQARIKSPSRETFDIGTLMGLGLSRGVVASKPKVKASGRGLIESLLIGITTGSSGIDKALDRIDKLVEKRINGKDQEKRQNTILRGLRDEYAALKANGRAQDANNTKLKAAEQHYKDLVQAAKDYSNGIRDSVVASGSVVGLGTNENDATVSTTDLLNQLKQKVILAQRYSALIKKLRKEGLNATSIQQLLDAGVDGGLSTAEAIQAGGLSAIGQINHLTTQLQTAGGSLGDAMAKSFKQAGINAADGLVEGLKAKQKELDRAADRLGRLLAAAVKKALGIKSPSRVFRGIGDNTIKGLALGLDEVYVKRQGTRLATALQAGFSRPDLAAGVLTPTAGTAPVVIHLTVNAPVGASSASIGRDLAGHLDEYFKHGGVMTA